MDFIYYIVRKSDSVILDGAPDVVSSVKIAENQGCACLIVQGCIIAEIGQDKIPSHADVDIDVDDLDKEQEESVEVLSVEE